MAESVTRHAPITEEEIKELLPKTGPWEWQLLLCGLDSLDLGLYVDWGEAWDDLADVLDKGKQEAEGTQGIALAWPKVKQCLILPSGKPPQFRYHLQTPTAHLFIGRSRKPNGDTPNAYISLLAEALWYLGTRKAVGEVHRLIAHLGGKVISEKVSRCDLAADFELGGGLSLDFLREHKVTDARASRCHMEGEQLQTYYVGSPSSPIQARIYDKAAEIEHSGKAWFLALWNREEAGNIWRVEFQLRRPVLKQFRINTVEELLLRAGDIWQFLTDGWLSFRLHDDVNTTRRSVHPWWRAVQEASRDMGKHQQIHREDIPTNAPVRWYVSHIGGCLVPFAARTKQPGVEEALFELGQAVREYWEKKADFDERLEAERIRIGLGACSEGISDED